MTAVRGTVLPPVGPESVGTTFRRLAQAQKGAAGAPAYSRFVNRPAGRLFAALAFRAGLTPNAVTGVSATFTFLGIALLLAFPASWPLGCAVAACLVIGYAFDAADGQLARLRGGGSPSGEWLDHMVDAVKAAVIHLALLVSFYRFAEVHRGPLLLVPIAYTVVDVVHLFATLLNEQLRRNHGAAERADRSDRQPSTLRSLLVLPTDYGVLALSLVLLGAPSVFFGVYFFLFVGTAGYVVLASRHWFQEMGRLRS